MSEYGSRIFADVRPFSPGDEEDAQARAQRVADCAAAFDMVRFDAVRDALRSAPEAIGPIARASMGDVLADANFFELQRFCDAVDHVDGLVNGSAGIEPILNSGVRAVREALAPGRTGAYEFYLADAFDVALAAARAELADAQADLDAARGRTLDADRGSAKARRRLERRVHRYAGRCRRSASGGSARASRSADVLSVHGGA